MLSMKFLHTYIGILMIVTRLPVPKKLSQSMRRSASNGHRSMSNRLVDHTKFIDRHLSIIN